MIDILRLIRIRIMRIHHNISTSTGVTIAEALSCQVAANLVKLGIEPPVFRSSNVDGGDAYNKWMFEKYYGYWK